MRISGYVPFYNNAPTVLAAVDSLRAQQPPLDEVFAVDDGSTDGGAVLLKSAGVRVIRQPSNLGRGAVRARAMVEADHELVLCCDATNILPSNFAAKARTWFADSEVAAVFGRIGQPPGGDAVTRWRGRHLFRVPRPGTPSGPIRRDGTLATYGAIVRRSACLRVGNYDAARRHTEDAELGERLRRAGFDVIFDPGLETISMTRNSLSQVMERYWRWNAGKDETVSCRTYLRAVWFSLRVMAVRDLADHDLPAALISLYSPHFQFWRSLLRRATRARE
jgi:GT2 family glycosyltransferase